MPKLILNKENVAEVEKYLNNVCDAIVKDIIWRMEDNDGELDRDITSRLEEVGELGNAAIRAVVNDPLNKDSHFLMEELMGSGAVNFLEAMVVSKLVGNVLEEGERMVNDGEDKARHTADEDSVDEAKGTPTSPGDIGERLGRREGEYEEGDQGDEVEAGLPQLP
ncbi:MAG: hypothetical protein ACXABY_09470 [Candidatus Thorarchaeota archaeon]|jgi:hypothetical protein